jgi:acetyl-CoA carboxylase carboxyl transferase subunit beta
MAWFSKDKKPKAVRAEGRPSTVPEGLWTKCAGCREIIYTKELVRNVHICPKCCHHFRIDAPTRIRLLLDQEDPPVLFSRVTPADPLKFKDSKRYRDRLRASAERLDVEEAVVVVEGTLEETPVLLAVMDFRFMGGSMGSVVGERLTRAIEACIAKRCPLVVVSASGGARMQEGALSLMQMAKVSAALARLRQAQLPYISILTDPTSGGVTASFAMLGDVNVAEPGALIAFAGARVIEQTIRESLPEGYQTAEFLLEHGFLDLVVKRTELKETVGTLLRHLT